MNSIPTHVDESFVHIEEKDPVQEQVLVFNQGNNLFYFSYQNKMEVPKNTVSFRSMVPVCQRFRNVMREEQDSLTILTGFLDIDFPFMS